MLMAVGIIAQLYNNKMEQRKKGWNNSDEQERWLQCGQHLSDLNGNRSQWRRPGTGPPGCDCQEMKENAAERRRLKRRKHKQKNKKKLRQVKQKAMIVFQNIIKEIYSLSANYQSVQNLLEECFLLEDNNQILYNQIDEIMRHEIDVIRKRIVGELAKYQGQPEEGKERGIRNIFDSVYKIQKGSPQIEKIINLYVKRRFGDEEEEPPLKTNLDLMTLKFLYINDLEPSESFAEIVEEISKNEAFRREREIYETMMVAATRIQCSSHSSEWSGYESEEQEGYEGVQVGEPKEKEASRKKRRRERKRKVRVEVQSSFQSIMQRVQQLQLVEERLQCKVQEIWVQRMQSKQQEYKSKPPTRK